MINISRLIYHENIIIHNQIKDASDMTLTMGSLSIRYGGNSFSTGNAAKSSRISKNCYAKS